MTIENPDLNERVRSEKARVNEKASNGDPIGWNGRSLKEMLESAKAEYKETGHCYGIEELGLKSESPIKYEKIFSRLRGGLVNARETALNISASPIVKEIGELCFVLFTPPGDSVVLSTGIIVHVHTTSDAIKWMIHHEYEENPGIEPGDIFCNNDPHIGDVHNTDVQTIVPIFWEGELVAWAAGITHEVDIGAATPGGDPVGPTSRFDDGFDIPAQKIGSNDTLHQDYVERAEMGVRTPELWKLDERCRLAGCHMIRDAVHSLIEEEGVDTYKQFIQEVIEDGRRDFKTRLEELTVPGEYEAPTFTDLPLEDEQGLPRQAAYNEMMHAPLNVEIGSDRSFELDFDGANAQGKHVFNCTPSALQGAIWVLLTQTIIPNSKINDGAYYATDTNAPEGAWCNPDTVRAATADAWHFLRPSLSGMLRSLSRSFNARGYVEEMASSYGDTCNYFQGEGTDMFGQDFATLNFELSSQGFGARGFTDGIDAAYAMWNPEADLGECEVWELLEPALYLGRRLKPNSGGMGRYRGGTAFESVRMAWGTDELFLQNNGNGLAFNSPGMFGGYPSSTGYIHNVRDNDLEERIENRDPYPVRDGTPEDSQMSEFVDGDDRQFEERGTSLLHEYDERDLYLSVNRGGAGLGDPLERDPADVEDDLNGEHIQPRYAERVYGVYIEETEDGYEVDPEKTAERRTEIRAERAQKATPVSEWLDERRDEVENEEFIPVVKRMYNESIELSEEWGDHFREFWDLPEEFTFDTEE
jgi:N-methylhydantoinase B/acetone carboxylase alpha subunit